MWWIMILPFIQDVYQETHKLVSKAQYRPLNLKDNTNKSYDYLFILIYAILKMLLAKDINSWCSTLATLPVHEVEIKQQVSNNVPRRW